MKKLLIAAFLAASIATPATAEDLPPANPDDFICQFSDLPRMRFQRHDPDNYTLRIDHSLPVKLDVGSQMAIAEFDGQELVFWEDGISVRIANVLYKGTCK